MHVIRLFRDYRIKYLIKIKEILNIFANFFGFLFKILS